MAFSYRCPCGFAVSEMPGSIPKSLVPGSLRQTGSRDRLIGERLSFGPDDLLVFMPLAGDDDDVVGPSVVERELDGTLAVELESNVIVLSDARADGVGNPHRIFVARIVARQHDTIGQ